MVQYFACIFAFAFVCVKQVNHEINPSASIFFFLSLFLSQYFFGKGVCFCICYCLFTSSEVMDILLQCFFPKFAFIPVMFYFRQRKFPALLEPLDVGVSSIQAFSCFFICSTNVRTRSSFCSRLATEAFTTSAVWEIGRKNTL